MAAVGLMIAGIVVANLHLLMAALVCVVLYIGLAVGFSSKRKT